MSKNVNAGDQHRKMLVTGGAGFIGSNLVANLLREGCHVDCVDNFTTGLKTNVNRFSDNVRFRFYEQDIATEEFTQTFKGRKYDEIYHLACPTGVPNIRLLGKEMLDTCSLGTANVVDIVRDSGARMIFTSSCEVYGDPQVFPQAETYSGNVDPRGPRGPYEEGKRFSEAYIMMAVRKHDIDAKIVRIFNTYGIGMSYKDQRIVPRFIENGLLGKPMTVYGDGSQNRTYLYVDDNVEGLKTVLRQGTPGKVYNLGGVDQVTVRELAKIVNTLIPNPVAINQEPHFIEDHKGRLPDTTEIRKLGWKPTVSLGSGLTRMIDDVYMRITAKDETRHLAAHTAKSRQSTQSESVTGT